MLPVLEAEKVVSAPLVSSGLSRSVREHLPGLALVVPVPLVFAVGPLLVVQLVLAVLRLQELELGLAEEAEPGLLLLERPARGLLEELELVLEVGKRLTLLDFVPKALFAPERSSHSLV